MVVRKFSISLSLELADTLRELAADWQQDTSGLIEILLREHRAVVGAIQRRRERLPRHNPA